ncbi:MAG: integrase [Thiotrichaceae bacterium]|nr:MAG: integrase [Thiotrichaceae bacterium]
MATAPLQIHILNELQALANNLDNAMHSQRGKLMDTFATKFGWSKQKVYRQLSGIGWSSGRKARADKGTTSQCMDALTDLSAVQRLGVRKNGKITSQTPNARSLLASNGRDFAVSNARLNVLLKERGMDVNAQKQQSACQPLRTLHPNHVHLVDPSLCLLYYDPQGNQHVIRDDEAYKNKPDFIEKIKKFKVWRYVLVDHFSSVVAVKYYRSHGETQANMYDFLLWCWQHTDSSPFHGVPFTLYWDKGSANTASAIKTALHALGVNAIEHEAGNPRAKGAVEQANNLVEKLFESRLRYEPVADVDQLNDAVQGWMNAYNSNTIPHYDSRLKRRFMAEPRARYEIWQIIRREQLRLLPDEQVCRYLLTAEPVERKVRADLTVSFKHPVTKKQMWYDVAGIQDVYPKAIVKVGPLIYGDAEIILYVENYRGEDAEHILQPMIGDEFSGFNMDAAVIGDEMKSQPDTIIEQAGKAADQVAFPGKTEKEIKKLQRKNAVPFEGTIDAHSHLANTNMPSYMQRPGSDLDVPNRMQVEVKPLTYIEAAKLLIQQLGRTLTPDDNQMMRETYPDGVPPDEIENLCELIRTGQTPNKNSLQLVK